MRTTVTSSLALVFLASTAYAEPLRCSLANYTALPGLTATVADDTLTVAWEGDDGAQLRMRFAIERGTPTIRELAIQPQGGQGARWWPT